MHHDSDGAPDEAHQSTSFCDLAQDVIGEESSSTTTKLQFLEHFKTAKSSWKNAAIADYLNENIEEDGKIFVQSSPGKKRVWLKVPQLEKPEEQNDAWRNFSHNHKGTMTNVIEAIHRFTSNRVEIMRETEVLLISDATKADGDVDELIAECANILELLGLLDAICSIMGSYHVQTEERTDDFESACCDFGLKYRRFFNNMGTPKLHLLEAHLPFQLRLRKNLGLFDESGVERGMLLRDCMRT